MEVLNVIRLERRISEMEDYVLSLERQDHKLNSMTNYC